MQEITVTKVELFKTGTGDFGDWELYKIDTNIGRASCFRKAATEHVCGAQPGTTWNAEVVPDSLGQPEIKKAEQVFGASGGPVPAQAAAPATPSAPPPTWTQTSGPAPAAPALPPMGSAPPTPANDAKEHGICACNASTAVSRMIAGGIIPYGSRHEVFNEWMAMLEGRELPRIDTPVVAKAFTSIPAEADDGPRDDSEVLPF